MGLSYAAGCCMLLAMFACGGASSKVQPPPSSKRPAIRFAVLTPSWATDPEAIHIEAGGLIVGAEELGGVRAERVDEGPQCASEPPCLERLAARELAKVVTIRLAALGETVLIRGTLVDTETGTQDETRQVVVNTASAESINQAMRALGRAFAKPFVPPPPPPKKESPAYETWWFWTTIGASLAVTAGVVTGAVVATQPQPDVVITPP